MHVWMASTKHMGIWNIVWFGWKQSRLVYSLSCCCLLPNQVIKVEWMNKDMREVCFDFLFKKFKQSYLRWLLPDIDRTRTIYDPDLGRILFTTYVLIQNQKQEKNCPRVIVWWNRKAWNHVTQKVLATFVLWSRSTKEMRLVTRK